VEEGDAVRKGDIIAAVGQTGAATGPHLHFEIRVNGELQDPAAVLDKAEDVG
ncbi:MAG: M23 family metallopeptidase, partial [Clostridia bacterium]|nr:M23 family metallopeptidase [Clostridia bacterium]